MAYLIKEKRIGAGMTQTELAKLAGVSRQTINYLENNDLSICKTDTLSKIAHALKCQVSDIILN